MMATQLLQFAIQGKLNRHVFLAFSFLVVSDHHTLKYRIHFVIAPPLHPFGVVRK